MTTVGLVGTGEMGWRMARLLVDAGHAVVGYDIRAEALARAEAVGAEPARSAAEAAARAEVVITCVPDGRALEAAVRGPGGVLEGLSPGKTVIDTTSAEPWVTKEIADALAGAGVAFLDAPVSGGVPAAEAGRMNFMVGGEARVLERWRDLLTVLGPTIAHVGPVGAGHTVKALNMLAMAGSFMATAEALAAGQAAGIPPGRLVEVLNASSGGSYVSRVHFPRFILPGTYDSGFTFDLMLKDLGIGIVLAERLGFTAVMARRVHDLYRMAARLGYSGRDNTTIANLVFRPGPTSKGEEDPTGASAGAEIGRPGFVGLGAMGSRMAARLIECSYAPVVFDTNPKAVEAMVAKGASPAESPAAVARAADIVLLSLPNAAIVEAVVAGPNGVLEGLDGRPPGTLVIDTSSSKSATTRRLAERLRTVGADLVDAPVSRGQPAAERGELSIMLGGSAEARSRARPILELLGTDLIMIGESGTGHDAKALNNLVNAANVVIGGEVLLLAAKAGLDPRVAVDVLNAGSGGSEVLAKRYVPYALKNRFDSNFRMDLMLKDATYGIELAGEARVPAPVSATAVQVYALALDHLGRDADNTELVKFLEAVNDVNLLGKH